MVCTKDVACRGNEESRIPLGKEAASRVSLALRPMCNRIKVLAESLCRASDSPNGGC